MITASAFVMKVPDQRRELLLHYTEFEEKFGEPVTDFEHSRRAPLIVLMAFEDGYITHLGSGKKGMPGSGGTGLIRLNVRQIEAIKPAVAITELVALAPARVRSHVNRVLENGGLLPPKSLGALMDALIQIRARACRTSSTIF